MTCGVRGWSVAVRVGKGRHARLLWVNVKKRGHLEDKGVVVERVLLKRTLKKQDGRSGFIWLSLGTGDRLL